MPLCLLALFLCWLWTCNAWTRGDVIPVLVSMRLNDSTQLQPQRVSDQYSPRFGVDRSVRIQTTNPVFAIMQLFDDAHGADLRIRLELGRGLKKRTPWIVVHGMSHGRHVHLSKIQLRFGYQKNVFARLTSVRWHVSHSERPQDHIELEYLWVEQRSYDPNQAITFASAISLIAVAILTFFISSSESKKARYKLLVVRDREE